jgi:hypothetical protein
LKHADEPGSDRRPKWTRLKGIVRQRWARLTADYAVDERGVAVE